MSSRDELSQESSLNRLIDFLSASPFFNANACLLVLELLGRKVLCLNPAFRLSPASGDEAPADALPSPAKEWNEVALERALRKLSELSTELERKVNLAVDPMEMIAAIICETYAEAGEDAVIADDEALLMIRDLLLDNDRASLERNRGKCLAARVRAWDALSA